MWLATEATATAGAMPTKISSGVIRNPPPMPNIAGHETDRRAHRQDEENIDRDVGDRKVKLHARLLFGL